jgi:Cthe_2314-like HEPN
MRANQSAASAPAAAPPLRKRFAPKRQRSAFLVRHVLPSDTHTFVGRIFDLSIVGMHFDTYEELARHPDCKYAFDVNGEVSSLVRRVESLNLAGDLLWPSPLPQDFKNFPLSRYEWLTLAADVFLMRYVSVVDCALLVVNAVFELGLDPKRCSIENLRRRSVLDLVIALLQQMLDDQGDLRKERNARVHHGVERGFTDDDISFRTGSMIEHTWGGVGGEDRFGRKLNVERMFKQGLVELQQEFNAATRRLVRQLDLLYDQLLPAFEERFGPRIRSATHGLRSGSMRD